MKPWRRYRVLIYDEQGDGNAVYDSTFAGASPVEALYYLVENELLRWAKVGCPEQILRPMSLALSSAVSVARAVDLRGSTPRTDRAIREAVMTVRSLQPTSQSLWRLWRDRTMR